MPARSSLRLRAALAAQLRLFRVNKGFTQEKLAELAGLHRNHISLLERGLRSPTVDILDRLASALRVSVSEIISGAEGLIQKEKPHD